MGLRGMPLTYDPEQSATWQIIHEEENCQLITEHGPTDTSNPSTNKPVAVILTPSKEYNPQSSATWQALQETDPSVDPAKVANYSSLKEHDPIYSEVYTTPVAPKPGQRPPPRTNALPGPRSPVSELLPPSMRPAVEQNQQQQHHQQQQQQQHAINYSGGGSVLSPTKPVSGTGVSPVLTATLAENKPYTQPITNEKIPLYETNSIGGRRKIAQTASFNKLMMDVLGE
ncbi:hypothetical protein Pcinc_013897 [Petrolisthes cinctipes]|uniref:Uncharacterized protein n=1 Tax=Petrolisthes cinctipes TaxID=88211 RepID=A0AAE1KRV8_PETCI|nr:hypothetical protein Pcinc_013897 [Petrolisthes cinctipes]